VFAKKMIFVFRDKYLRAPNKDTKRLMVMNESRGWPVILGSIECMRWKWKKCPIAWNEKFIGHHRDRTVVLKATSKDLWI
jgi:hypothetical protein